MSLWSPFSQRRTTWAQNSGSNTRGSTRTGAVGGADHQARRPPSLRTERASAAICSAAASSGRLSKVAATRWLRIEHDHAQAQGPARLRRRRRRHPGPAAAAREPALAVAQQQARPSASPPSFVHGGAEAAARPAWAATTTSTTPRVLAAIEAKAANWPASRVLARSSTATSATARAGERPDELAQLAVEARQQEVGNAIAGSKAERGMVIAVHGRRGEWWAL